MRLFNIDNPVIRGILKVFDCIVVSGLWLIFSLPVVTAGAASAALYTVTVKYLRRGEGYLWRTFWDAFRENLKRSTLVWLAALAVQALFVLDALVFRALLLDGNDIGRLYWLMLVLCCVALTWTVYLTGYGAQFNGTVWEVLKYGFLMMALHPVRAVEVFVVVLAELALIIVEPGFVLILPAAASLAVSFVLEKVFLLHMSEEDKEKIKADSSEKSQRRI